MLNFWTGLLLGWLLTGVTTAIVLMFFASIKRNDRLYDDQTYDPEEKLKGRWK